MLGLKRGTVELCHYDRAWEKNAAQTIEKLKAILGGSADDIQHIGSTAIRHTMAKPIIDISVAVNDFDEVMKLVPALEHSGFMYRRQDAAEDMLFVCGDPDADTRTHHIRLVKSGSSQWHDDMNFRNYLNAKPHIAKEYGTLKLGLMSEYRTDRPAYTEGKAEFIRRTLQKARVWSLLGKMLTVTIDCPLGSVHQQHEGTAYPLNCGYADDVISPDGEKTGVYVCAEKRPLEKFTGRAAAIVHHEGDAEDKVVALPEGMAMTEEEIYTAVSFLEGDHDFTIDMFNPNIIHILGASGSGTTTLGKAISEKYRFKHLDADDYFWLPTDPAYTTRRELSQRQILLSEAIASEQRCVISGSLCGWGDVFMPKFELVILVEAPTETRIDRLKLREYSCFGHRILPGGDMYANHVEFLEWAARYDTAGNEQRSRVMHTQWLKRIYCPILFVDGTKPINETLAWLGSVIRRRHAN